MKNTRTMKNTREKTREKIERLREMHENETNTQTQGKEQTRTHTHPRATDTDPQFTDRATKVVKVTVETRAD